MAKTFIRFNNVTIDPEAVVTRAYVVFTAYESSSVVDANVKCYFENADNPSAPSSKANLDSRSLTSSIDWTNLSEWVDNRVYTSPDLSSILQTVMDRDGWQSGNSILFIMNDDNSPSNRHRMFSAIDFRSGVERAELRISWEPARQIERIDFIPAPGAYSNDINVEMDAYPSGCSIYYTLDGSDPDQNSALYSTALPLLTSEYNYHIRARAYKQYWLPSDIYDAYYFTTQYVWYETVLGTGTNRIWHCSIAIDSNDKIHVAFSKSDFVVDAPYQAVLIYYTNKVSGSWSPLEEVYQLIRIGSVFGRTGSLKLLLDSSDNPIIYFSNIHDGPAADNIGRSVKSGGLWSTTYPISPSVSNNYAAYVAARIGSDDKEHIVWIDSQLSKLNYVYYDGSWGGHYTVASDTSLLKDIRLDKDDYVYVLYSKGDSLEIGGYYYKTNVTGSWVEVQFTESGTYTLDRFSAGEGKIGIGYDKEIHLINAGPQINPNALCTGVSHYYNNIVVRYYYEDSTWKRKLYVTQGYNLSRAGSCPGSLYGMFDMVMLNITGIYYVPTYIWLKASGSVWQVIYSRGYGSDFVIETSVEVPPDAQIDIDSNNDNHMVWIVNQDELNDYYLKYGTTYIETRTYL
jgi:hypothetical protein